MNDHRGGKAYIDSIRELGARRLDGLRLIRMMDSQAEVLRDETGEILCAGGNRGSKTVTAAVRFASIARDEPVRAMDGSLIDCRMESQKDRPLLMWAIGDQLNHIGQVMHRVLFRSGLFWIVRDDVTGAWRSWNPVLYPDDWERKGERKPSPPLIPKSLIKSVAWYHRNLFQFERVVLKNGTEIYAYAASSNDRQGVAVDEIWVDENLQRYSTYAELLSRLTDKGGRLFWSTIPRIGCPAYRAVEERAESQRQEVEDGHRKPEEVITKQYTLSLLDNDFISQKDKEKRQQQLNEQDRLIRIHGVSATNLIRIYQEFNPDVHCVDYKIAEMNDEVTEALRANNWVPPADWTKELVLDPGTQKPGIIFGAVPPPSMWYEDEPTYVVWGEIYIPRLDAHQLAQKVSERCRGLQFERFIVDGQAARQKPMGFSWTIGEQYQNAFASEGLTCRRSGSMFIPGDPSFLQASGRVHTAMRMRRCGYPQLRIVLPSCPNLVKQIERNIRKTDVEGNPLEEEAPHQKNDLRRCLEYWMSQHPTYVAPPNGGVSDLPGVAMWKRRREEWKRSRKQHAAVNGGFDNDAIDVGVTTHT